MAVMDAGGLTFIRFLGMNFVVAGFVSPELSSDFASKVGWGDFIAAVLALFSMAALSWRWSIAIPVVWLFNIWGTLDLLNAYYMGVAQLRDPGLMAAGIYVPALYVPLLLVSHVLIFPITPTRRGMASSGLSLFHHPRAVAILMDGLLSAISPYGTKRKCRNARRRRIHRPLGGCARSLRRGRKISSVRMLSKSAQVKTGDKSERIKRGTRRRVSIAPTRSGGTPDQVQSRDPLRRHPKAGQ
jgi:hypothetical protein